MAKVTRVSDHCWFCRRKPVPGSNGMAVVCKRHKNRKVMVDATFSVAPFVIEPRCYTSVR
jgi:hypothetical protein